MSTLLFILIGFITTKTMESCDITMGDWQFWVIAACIIASMSVGFFLM